MIISRRGVGDLRVAHVVVVESLNAVVGDDVREDREGVFARRWVGRIGVDALPVGAADRVEVLHTARPQQPVRMAVDEMVARAGKRSRRARPNEEHVAPGVHPDADRGSRTHQMLERIEPVAFQLLGAWLER